LKGGYIPMIIHIIRLTMIHTTILVIRLRTVTICITKTPLVTLQETLVLIHHCGIYPNFLQEENKNTCRAGHIPLLHLDRFAAIPGIDRLDHTRTIQSDKVLRIATIAKNTTTDRLPLNIDLWGTEDPKDTNIGKVHLWRGIHPPEIIIPTVTTQVADVNIFVGNLSLLRTVRWNQCIHVGEVWRKEKGHSYHPQDIYCLCRLN